MSNDAVCAILDLIRDEVAQAQSPQDLKRILTIARELLHANTQRNVVRGIDYVRAEVDPVAIRRAGKCLTKGING